MKIFIIYQVFAHIKRHGSETSFYPFKTFIQKDISHIKLYNLTGRHNHALLELYLSLIQSPFLNLVWNLLKPDTCICTQTFIRQLMAT